jgi:hypothetical protein
MKKSRMSILMSRADELMLRVRKRCTTWKLFKSKCGKVSRMGRSKKVMKRMPPASGVRILLCNGLHSTSPGGL